MPRKHRLESPGAIYHINHRGNHQEYVYRDDDDRKLFLKLLKNTIGRMNWICHAYCLMGNHTTISSLRSPRVSYPWSSYRATVGKITPPEYLFVDDILSCLSTDRWNAQLFFQELVGMDLKENTNRSGREKLPWTGSRESKDSQQVNHK